MRKLTSRDHVVAIIGEGASGRCLEGAPIAQAAGVPVVSPAATNPKVTEVGDQIFRVCFTDPFQGTVMATFARRSLKAKRVGLLVDVGASYSVGLADHFRQRFIADGGEIVADQRFSGGDKDLRAQLTAIGRAGSAESRAIRDALAATKDFDGVTGMITIDAHRDARKPAAIIRVQDGRFRFVETVAP